jgi:hypothetical protein
MDQTPKMLPNDIKKTITRINELDVLSINSRMPIDKLGSNQRKSLFKQFNQYIQPLYAVTKSST